MRTGIRGLVALVLPVVALGCGGKADLPPVLVGHMAPLSGPDKAAGVSARRGIALAVEEANRDPEEKGAGRRVEVLHTDTQGDSRAFGAQATRLVKINKVAAVLGGNSPNDIKEFNRLAQAGVILVSPSGMPEDEARSKAAFFTGLSRADQGQVLARFAARQKYRHVVILYGPDDQDQALAEAFREKYLQVMASKSSRTRGRVGGSWRFGKDAPIQARARRITGRMDGGRREQPPPVDAILVAGKPPDVIRLREALGAGRPAIPILFGGAEGALPELLEDPQTGSDVYLVTAFSQDADFEQAREFVRHFQKRFGEKPDVHAALAYDDARLLFVALRLAKEKENSTVEKALSELKDFPSLTGPVFFDKNNQARRGAFVLRIDRGQTTRVARYDPEQ